MHRHLRPPLYLCFVDLKSAYDQVQWQLLWDLLRRLGGAGHHVGRHTVLIQQLLTLHEDQWRDWGQPSPLHGVAAGLPPQCHLVRPLY